MERCGTQLLLLHGHSVNVLGKTRTLKQEPQRLNLHIRMVVPRWLKIYIHISLPECRIKLKHDYG